MADVACHAAVALRRGRRRLPRRAASGAHHRGRRRTRLWREAAIRRYEAITARTLSRRRIALYHALAMGALKGEDRYDAVVSTLPPFFILDGERVVATESTRGPWSRHHQHGGPPAALLARAMEGLAGEGTAPAPAALRVPPPPPLPPLALRPGGDRAG